MFDIGFLELVLCAVIALVVLGPERLPVAARAAGRWIGNARRLVNQFSSELDRQLKADELREELRKAGGDIGLEDVQKSVQSALDEARKYEKTILPDSKASAPKPAASGPSDDGASAPVSPADPAEVSTGTAGDPEDSAVPAATDTRRPTKPE